MKTYQFVTICNFGFEDLVKEEIEEILHVEAISKKAHVFFETTLEKILLYVYRTQAAKQVLLLLGKFNASQDIPQQLESVDYSLITGSFCVRCKKSALEKELGGVVYKKLNNPKVDMKNADYPLYVHWHDAEGIIGINLAGDLSKRSYRVFAHPSSIKGTLAYFLVALSGFKGKGVFLDPSAGSGTIAAEAAFKVSGYPVRYYDKNELVKTTLFEDHDVYVSKTLREYDKAWKAEEHPVLMIRSYDVDLQSVNAAKKNFKIAGVEKMIDPAKADIQWLDTKFEKQSVDFIVSNPPAYTKFTQKQNDKFFEGFFYHAEFILSKKGSITLLLNSKNTLQFAEKHGFKATLLKQFIIGDKDWSIYQFKR
jgi:putative N6-adenine-specific DNA methylase